jgi:hypothetical protein
MNEMKDWFNSIAIWANIIAFILCAIQGMFCWLHGRDKAE